jgi:REP element-mobilizing transposase RayT
MEQDPKPGRSHRATYSPAGRLDCQRYLPRLAFDFYRGFSFVHWTLTIEDRATCWLAEPFHHRWQLCLLHTCARYRLFCPAYVLMPDHMHLIWLGVCEESDQRIAIEFLRKHLRSALLPAIWQKQAHDHVLGQDEQRREAFLWTANYIFENPVRAGLVARYVNYPYVGSCIPGYPDLDVRTPDYWQRFWRVYDHVMALQPTRLRSRPQDPQQR